MTQPQKLLIIGLGNPGIKYKNTRHNLGELIISAWAKRNRFPEFKFNKKLKSFLCKTFFNNQKIILALPQTFMNESGIATAQIAESFKIPAQNIWIFHDDIDLTIGRIKISKNRSSGGHKGVESIAKYLKTKNFARFRIGIGNDLKEKQKAEDFVLGKFNSLEKDILKNVLIKKTFFALETALKEGIEKAMNKFN